MHREEVLAAVVIIVLLITGIDAYPDKGKVCPRNLIVNGTNLITNYRQQILVLGVTHLGCQACRNQAVRYNDLYRDLAYHNIREPEVRFVLINEESAIQYLPGQFYGKVRVFQDNPRDRAIEKLGYHGQRLNNLVFGRCGFLVYAQTFPYSNIEDESNYQQLLQVILSVAKYKQPCSSTCL